MRLSHGEDPSISRSINQSIKNVLENKNELTPVPPNIMRFQQWCIIACRYKYKIALVTFSTHASNLRHLSHW